MKQELSVGFNSNEGELQSLCLINTSLYVCMMRNTARRSTTMQENKRHGGAGEQKMFFYKINTNTSISLIIWAIKMFCFWQIKYHFLLKSLHFCPDVMIKKFNSYVHLMSKKLKDNTYNIYPFGFFFWLFLLDFSPKSPPSLHHFVQIILN